MAQSTKILIPRWFRKAERSYQRSAFLDALRGSGIILMVIFHFFYDLTLFNLAEIPIYQSAFWISFRYLILAIFLSSVGMALYVHAHRGINWKAYHRRLLLLFMNSALITLVTYFVMREQFIFFGILHLIFVSSILALLFLRAGWLNLLLGIAIVYIGFNYGNPFFNQPEFRWLGMLTVATGSADFTPIFPWFGIVLVGIFIAHALGQNMYSLMSRNNSVIRILGLAGRHGLLIYMLHQPILWAVIYLWTLLPNIPSI